MMFCGMSSGIFGPNGDIFTTGAGEVSDDRVEFRPPTLIENTMMTWEVVAIDEASAELLHLRGGVFS